MRELISLGLVFVVIPVCLFFFCLIMDFLMTRFCFMGILMMRYFMSNVISLWFLFNIIFITSLTRFVELGTI